MKRTFDVMASFMGLIILSPVLILISLIIKFHDPGPVIFAQKRVGKNGKTFIVYKFRSMRVLEKAGEGSFEPGDLSRITPIGNLLRKFKLDELPQLYNVLTGDMSLVGPRPEIEKWVAAYPEKWRLVLTVRPGITDNASLLYRNEETLLAASDDPENTYGKIILPHKLELYEYYVRNHSFWGDLKLIFSTLYTALANPTQTKP
jgi:lipopolysaccharide/colanic/teichoic acid biosynthesis glycosyltransferase